LFIGSRGLFRASFRPDLAVDALASLALCLHQPRQATLTPKLLIVLGTQKKGGLSGRPLSISELY
jgi:hypothetical protein